MSETIKDVYSFLIPMLQDHLLIPNESVAEIVPFMNVSLFEGVEQNKDVQIGTLRWRNAEIPVISLERVQGEQNIGEVRRSRIAVLYTLNSNLKIPYIALSVQGIPRLVAVDAKNSELLDNGQAPQNGVMAWIKVDNKKALIPDLDYIEGILAE